MVASPLASRMVRIRSRRSMVLLACGGLCTPELMRALAGVLERGGVFGVGLVAVVMEAVN